MSTVLLHTVLQSYKTVDETVDETAAGAIQ